MQYPRPILAVSITLAIAGCATYSPDPLPPKVDLADALPAQMARPLDMNAVATVAILNNPDLRTARAKSKIGEAQAFAAGILPNPQLNAELVTPTNQGDVGGNGFGFGLSYDLQALVTRGAKVGAANAARDEARLDLLWQEWQTVAQARNFYVQRINASGKRELYASLEAKYATQAERSGRALQTGDVTFDQAGVDLAALLDVRSQLSTAERTASQSDYSLHTLLGVAPQVDVPLQPLALPPIPGKDEVEEALAKVSQLRPDLRALQFGYQSQEENLRKSVLAQFPSLSLGVTRQSDTAGDTSSFGTVIHAVSIGATLNLPLFDRNQGDIAVQRATRAQLRAEYQARLDQTTGDAWRIWTEMRQLASAIKDLQDRLPELQVAAQNAETAYAAGDLPALTYATLQGAALTRQSELLDLEQSLWSDAIALSSVLGIQIQLELDNKEPIQ